MIAYRVEQPRLTKFTIFMLNNKLTMCKVTIFIVTLSVI